MDLNSAQHGTSSKVIFTLVALLVGGIVLGLRMFLLGQYPDFSFPDEYWYTEIAQNLVDGNGYVMEGDGHNRFAVCKAPALPFVLATVGSAIPLTPSTVKVVNILMNAGALLFLALAVFYSTQSHWFALLGLLLMGLHPAYAYTGVTNYPQNGQALLLGVLVFSMAYRKSYAPEMFLKKRWMVLDGLLIGIGALFVPTHVYLLPGLWFFWLMNLPEENRCKWIHASMRYAVCGLFGVLLVVGPWTVRNMTKEKSFIPFTATAGQQFYTGFNASAGMNTGTSVDVPEAMMAELETSLSAKEFEQVHWKYAKEWVEQNPLRALGLVGLKTLNYFRWDTGTLRSQSAQSSQVLIWVQRITTLGVFGLFLVGLMLGHARNRSLCMAMVLFLLFSALGHALFISRYRYRLPFEPAMLACAVMVLPGAVNRKTREAE